MKKNWLVALYKINEIKRLENNLLNQGFNFYLPKITIKKINSKPKEVALFPGYIFVNTGIENYTALKYTIGIKDIIKFGDNISYISDEDMKMIRETEEISKTDPVVPQIRIGQEVAIAKGSLEGFLVKICSLPSKNRVEVLLSFLGSMRKVTISKTDLAF